jgi:N-acetylneuraminate lyase
MKGVIPAMLSVYGEDENIDVKRTENLVDFLLGRGVHGLYLTGSTGESVLMTHAERALTVKTVVDRVAGKVPVIVHVGDIGTKKSIMLAEQAAAAGADAISSVPPFYFKFDNEAIVRYYRDLAAATDLPLIIYNIPLAGLMGEDLIFRLAELPGVKGIKYTAMNHAEMGHIKRVLGKDFAVFSGADEMACSGLCVGADGIIGSFYNVIPETFLRIYGSAQKNDYKEAARVQAIATDIILETIKYNLQPVLRNMLQWQGCDAGLSCRPFRSYHDDELAGLKKTLKAVKDKHGVTDEVEFYQYI